MSESETIEAQAQPHAKRLFLFALASMIVLSAYSIPSLSPLRPWLAYGLPLALGYFLVLIIAIYRAGTARPPLLPLLGGWAVIVGGTAFDVLITIARNPSLNLEANPVARAFLDSGHPLWFVYAYGFIAQVLFTLLIGLMWAAFLRHQPVILDLAWQLQPKTALEFINAAWRGSIKVDWFYGYRLSDYRHYKWYRTAQWLFCACMVFPLARFYFGLEWLGIRLPRNLMAGLLVSLLFLPYFIWLYLQFARGQRSSSQATPDSTV